jgi:hypothetical protein
MGASEPDELWERIQKRNQEDPPVERHQIDEWIAAFQDVVNEKIEGYDKVFFHGS